MAHTPAWRNFKRTEDFAVATAALIYAGGVVYAFDHLPMRTAQIALRTLIWPAVYLVASLALPLLLSSLRRPLTRYVWMSFRAGFGQTARSILAGLAMPVIAAAFMYWQITNATPGSPYPAGVFSAYGAGIGILAAQAALVRALEKQPEVKKEIEV
jgi:hypothetical protein